MEAIEYPVMSAAEEEHWWYLGVHDLVMRLIRAESIRLKRPLAILDAGCGTGRLCQLMRPFGEVSGCDIHPLALEATARRGIHPVFHCDLTLDELGTKQYDVITAIDVLYHRMVTDEQAVLRNMHRALKQRGLLVTHVAAFEILRGTHDAAVHARRRYRRRQLVRLLEAAGFKIQFASYRLFPFFLPGVVWRWVTRVFPRGQNGDEAPSDIARLNAPRINPLLASYVKVENHLLTSGIRFPLGTSVFAVARK
jgi:SAM-dependent methyltransferase